MAIILNYLTTICLTINAICMIGMYLISRSSLRKKKDFFDFLVDRLEKVEEELALLKSKEEGA